LARAPCRQAQNENSLFPCGDGFAKCRKKSQEIAMAKGQAKPSKEKKKPKAETSKKGTSSYKQAYGK
jgi:hypothetical protein